MCSSDLGGPSHIDLFDPKPEMAKYDGKTFPGKIKYDNAAQASSTVLASPWRFHKRGECGMELSELLPALGGIADDITLIRSMRTGVNNHGQSIRALNTGRVLGGRPSLGSWMTYGLGAETENLPAYVALIDPGQLPVLGVENWSNGWLPSIYQGTVVRPQEPRILNLDAPPQLAGTPQRRALDYLRRLNQRHLKKHPGELDLQARIASYELAGRMQTSVPEIMDLSAETEATLKAYGVDGGSELRGQYARNCILARRLLEKGVGVVQLFNGSDPSGGNGITNWDSHSNIARTHAIQAEIMDQPTAALIHDMKRRGLLERTLILWCTEFGRMPFLQANGTGRDHNPDAFTCFMAGAGVKKGFSYGESDEFGFKAAVNPTSVYDFNATILHLMGLDHERLTYYHNGLERRLTNVHGHVVKDVLA